MPLADEVEDISQPFLRIDGIEFGRFQQDADGCSACGGTMGKLGEDVTEVLEYVPGRRRPSRT